jgi:hypothetical protein
LFKSTVVPVEVLVSLAVPVPVVPLDKSTVLPVFVVVFSVVVPVVVVVQVLVFVLFSSTFVPQLAKIKVDNNATAKYFFILLKLVNKSLHA